jgi:hypothetical protein
VAVPEPDRDRPAPVDPLVEASRRWSVVRSGWKELLPYLPDDMIALLAAPIVVSVEPSAGDGRDGGEDDDDDEAERYPPPQDPCAGPPARYRHHGARSLTPAMPRYRARSR